MFVEYEDIAIFIQVAKEKNFERAAEQLLISPTTAFKKIARLEKTMDVKLFDRSLHRLHLTDAGKFFLEESPSLLEQLRNSIFRAGECAESQNQNSLYPPPLNV